MTKEKMISELTELLEVLDTPADKFAEMLNKKSSYKYEESDTYPIRLGIAKATIEYILTGKF